MACAKHPDRDGVGKCTECGAYVCAECAEKTAPLKSVLGVLCTNCYEEELTFTKNFYAKERKKKLRSAIISLVCYLIGWCLTINLFGIIPAQSGGGLGTIMPLIGLFLMGAYCAISGWKLASKQQDEYEKKHGATYVITDTGVYKEKNTLAKIFMFILGMVFGMILTPIFIIKWFIGAKNDSKEEKRFDDAIKGLNEDFSLEEEQELTAVAN